MVGQIELELELNAVLVGGENTGILLNSFIGLAQEVLCVISAVKRRQVDVLKKRLKSMTGQIIPTEEISIFNTA